MSQTKRPDFSERDASVLSVHCVHVQTQGYRVWQLRLLSARVAATTLTVLAGSRCCLLKSIQDLLKRNH